MKKYLGEYYHTKSKAKAALEVWREEHYKVIEERGDKVLRDDSGVYWNCVWTKPTPIDPKKPDGLCSSSQTNIVKWFIRRAIYTQSMIDDLSNMKPFDPQLDFPS